MQGKIIKGIAGFYDVYTECSEKGTAGIYECKAKGIFRKEQKKPLVGDDVMIDILDEEKKLGNIIRLLPRHSELIRPAVANIDQSLIIFSIVKPEPTFNLLDRFLIMMEQQGLESIICFNKLDIAPDSEREAITEAYAASSTPLIFVSAATGEGMEQLTALLKGKTTAAAGPSGVGKSSLINRLHPEANMETGDLSERIGRGRHTTRHTEIIALHENTFLMDTPGFTSLKLFDMEKEELKDYYKEFRQFEPYCRFSGCVHMNEPKCGIKDALQDGEISSVRYQNYQVLYQELLEQKKY